MSTPEQDYYKKEIAQEVKLRHAFQRIQRDLADAVNVLAGEGRVEHLVCDLCEKGKVTKRIRIFGPLHYWKRRPCAACRGNGHYRVVMNGKRGHLDWGRNSAYGSVDSSPKTQAFAFQPISSKSPSSPGATGTLSLLT